MTISGMTNHSKESHGRMSETSKMLLERGKFGQPTRINIMKPLVFKYDSSIS